MSRSTTVTTTNVTTEPQQILDGTPATFAAALKKYSDLTYRTMMIIAAAQPHKAECVFCGEPGGEYTIHAVVAVEDEGGKRDESCVWACHEKHFHTEVT